MIFFGDKNLSVKGNGFISLSQPQMFATPFFKDVQKNTQGDAVVFAHQIHSNRGYVISSREQACLFSPIKQPGDFLVTTMPGVILGVLTADCLPVILYDPEYEAFAVVHAGSKGTLQGVVREALGVLCMQYGTRPEQVQAFFGPSACVNCYEVQQDFVDQLQDVHYTEKTLEVRDGKFFFNVPLLNYLQLVDVGVNPIHISREHNLCTIEDRLYCSYRREQESPQRQITCAVLGDRY